MAVRKVAAAQTRLNCSSVELTCNIFQPQSVKQDSDPTTLRHLKCRQTGLRPPLDTARAVAMMCIDSSQDVTDLTAVPQLLLLGRKF